MSVRGSFCRSRVQTVAAVLCKQSSKAQHCDLYGCSRCLVVMACSCHSGRSVVAARAATRVHCIMQLCARNGRRRCVTCCNSSTIHLLALQWFDAAFSPAAVCTASMDVPCTDSIERPSAAPVAVTKMQCGGEHHDVNVAYSSVQPQFCLHTQSICNAQCVIHKASKELWPHALKIRVFECCEAAMRPVRHQHVVHAHPLARIENPGAEAQST